MLLILYTEVVNPFKELKNYSFNEVRRLLKYLNLMLRAKGIANATYKQRCFCEPPMYFVGQLLCPFKQNISSKLQPFACRQRAKIKGAIKERRSDWNEAVSRNKQFA